MMKKRGYTVVELAVALSIAAIMTSIAVPGYFRWLPSKKLRSAAMQLFSDMHLAKMTAIRNNTEGAVVFNLGGNRYQVWDGGANGDYGTGGDDALVKTIDLNDFGAGVCFGFGGAGGGVGGGNDEITFAGDTVIFNGRGMANVLGYAHLENKNKTVSYAVGSLTTGVVLLRKWDGANWE